MGHGSCGVGGHKKCDNRNYTLMGGILWCDRPVVAVIVSVDGCGCLTCMGEEEEDEGCGVGIDEVKED